jgi:hypothetical protein
MQESTPEQESEKGNPLLTVVFLIIGVLLILLLSMGLTKLKPGGEEFSYFGTWQRGKAIVKIQAKPEKTVSQKVQVSADSWGKLKMPVSISDRSGGAISMMSREGIYDVEGDDVLIVHCTVCRNYVYFGLKRKGDKLQIGFMDESGGSMQSAMYHLHGYRIYMPDKLHWKTFDAVKK